MSRALLVREVNAAIARQSGRNYAIKLDDLDDQSLREFLRLLRDLDHERLLSARRAQRQPWRRP